MRDQLAASLVLLAMALLASVLWTWHATTTAETLRLVAAYMRTAWLAAWVSTRLSVCPYCGARGASPCSSSCLRDARRSPCEACYARGEIRPVGLCVDPSHRESP